MNLSDDELSFKNKPLFNIGTGMDLAIKELAELIKEITDFKGEIVFGPSKPDGTPQKLLDVSKLTDLGWLSKIDLKQGKKRITLNFIKRKMEEYESLKQEISEAKRELEDEVV